MKMAMNRGEMKRKENELKTSFYPIFKIVLTSWPLRKVARFSQKDQRERVGSVTGGGRQKITHGQQKQSFIMQLFVSHITYTDLSMSVLRLVVPQLHDVRSLYWSGVCATYKNLLCAELPTVRVEVINMFLPQ